MNDRVRQGLASLCAAALSGLIWLAVHPTHDPMPGDSDTAGQFADAFGALAWFLLVLGLVLLTVGLLKPLRLRRHH